MPKSSFDCRTANSFGEASSYRTKNGADGKVNETDGASNGTVRKSNETDGEDDGRDENRE